MDALCLSECCFEPVYLGFLLWCELKGNHNYFEKLLVSAGTVPESTSFSLVEDY